MKVDIYIEIVPFNKNVDSLVRVLQRMEALGVWSRRDVTAYEMRVEELGANLNPDFAELICVEERFDQHRLRSSEWQRNLITQLQVMPACK
jgi:hypothetical protein